MPAQLEHDAAPETGALPSQMANSKRLQTLNALCSMLGSTKSRPPTFRPAISADGPKPLHLQKSPQTYLLTPCYSNCDAEFFDGRKFGIPFRVADPNSAHAPASKRRTGCFPP